MPLSDIPTQRIERDNISDRKMQLERADVRYIKSLLPMRNHDSQGVNLEIFDTRVHVNTCVVRMSCWYRGSSSDRSNFSSTSSDGYAFKWSTNHRDLTIDTTLASFARAQRESNATSCPYVN